MTRKTKKAAPRGFAAKLHTLKRKGGLTEAELARALRSPHSTVRSWLAGHEPRSDASKRVRKHVNFLVAAVANGALPLAKGLSRAKRQNDLKNRKLA